MNPICVEVDHISPTVVLIIIIIMVIISNIDCCCPRTHPTNPPCAILLSCGSSCSYALLLHTVYINRNILLSPSLPPPVPLLYSLLLSTIPCREHTNSNQPHINQDPTITTTERPPICQRNKELQNIWADGEEKAKSSLELWRRKVVKLPN